MRASARAISVLLFFFAFFPIASTPVSAACTNWQNRCTACENGTQFCNGTDENGKLCTVHQSCNLPSQQAIRSCDCTSGTYENGVWEIEGVGACGAPTQCIGDTGIAKSGMSGPTCHYCATPLQTPIPNLNIVENNTQVTNQADSQENTNGIYTPLPGLTLSLNAPSAVQNGQSIQYQITVTYDGANTSIPLDSITAYNRLPEKTSFVSATGQYEYNEKDSIISWSMKNPENQKNFSFVLQPREENILIVNSVTATTDVISNATGGRAQNVGNACTQKYEGSGYCTTGSLIKHFGGDGRKALIASMICQKESTSDPFAVNPKCPDYSVGLFQVNAIAHCLGAYAQPYKACRLLDAQKRNACETAWKNANENIQKMLSISSNGTNWVPWSTWPGVQQRLRECGI